MIGELNNTFVDKGIVFFNIPLGAMYEFNSALLFFHFIRATE